MFSLIAVISSKTNPHVRQLRYETRQVANISIRGVVRYLRGAASGLHRPPPGVGLRRGISRGREVEGEGGEEVSHIVPRNILYLN